MRPRALVFLLALALTFTWAGAAVAQKAELPAEAEQVAKELFEMLDQGKLKESFILATPSVQKTETDLLWYGHMESWRGSMGNPQSRELVGAEKISKFGDRPAGDYLKVVYKTSFPKFPDAEEFVVLALEEGKWGVVGYEVQYNRWPEARRIIANGLTATIFIMVLLAVLTTMVGKVVQAMEKRQAAALERKG